MSSFRQFLLEERRPFFHGTTSNNLRTILKVGMNPDPKSKVWGSDDHAQKESYLGTYFASNIRIAWSSAINAVNKFGGDKIIVEAQIQTRSAKIDEDELPHARFALQNAMKMLYPGTLLVRSTAESLLENPKLNEFLETAAILWMRDLASYLKQGMPKLSQQQKYILLPLAEKYILAELKFTAEHEGSQSYHEVEPPEKRKALSDIMDALGSITARMDYDGAMGSNVRVTEPVTFKGANKILSITQIDDSESPYILKPLYGSPSQVFLKQFENIAEYSLEG
jgi:hypothetical protein